jgi:hypothetical protein
MLSEGMTAFCFAIYIGRAPDAGEDYTVLAKNYPT